MAVGWKVEVGCPVSWATGRVPAAEDKSMARHFEGAWVGEPHPHEEVPCRGCAVLRGRSGCPPCVGLHILLWSLGRCHGEVLTLGIEKEN